MYSLISHVSVPSTSPHTGSVWMENWCPKLWKVVRNSSDVSLWLFRLMGGFWSRPTNLWFLLCSYQTGCVHQANCIRTAQRGRMTSCQVGAWPVSAPVNPTCSTSPALHMSPVYQDVPVLLGEWRRVAEYKPRRSDYILFCTCPLSSINWFQMEQPSLMLIFSEWHISCVFDQSNWWIAGCTFDCFYKCFLTGWQQLRL